MVAVQGEGRHCRECGGSLAGKDVRADFCSTPCRSKWWRRAQIRGGRVFQLLIDWRHARNKSWEGPRNQLSEIAHIVDEWITEDREAGRG